MMEPKQVALINGRIVFPERVSQDLALLIEGQPKAGKISALLPVDDLPEGIPTIDTGGRWITPGLIDIHTHGALGILSMNRKKRHIPPYCRKTCAAA
jgi:N-acetylglucosamine-6-phosphate deacetylase